MPQLLSPEHRDESELPSIVLRSEQQPQDLGPVYSSEPQIERRARQLLASDANKTTGYITEGAVHSAHVYHPSHSNSGSNLPRSTHEHLRLNIASFRLVRVLRLADDGTIRCATSNTTLDVSPLAWITQELLLSRELHLFAQEALFPFVKLCLKPLLENNICSPRGFWSKVASPGNLYGLRLIMEEISGAGKPIGLAENLEMYGEKLCEETRDLAYSLVSVSVDGAKLEVNYSLSPIELAREVLFLEQGKLCIWRAFMVMQTLKVHASPLSGMDASF